LNYAETYPEFANHKVYVHGPGAPNYMAMFKKLGFGSTPDVDEASIICFTGGEDVNPNLYGEKNMLVGGRLISGINPKRDDLDAFVYGIGLSNRARMVGICRGAQFLNVMNGGRMWQHVNGHAGGSHNLIDNFTGEIVKVTSTHHQMMRPHEDGTVIAVARESSVKLADQHEWHIEHDGPEDDVEVVWYPEQKCLCFQPHPEFNDADECRDYFAQLMERYVT